MPATLDAAQAAKRELRVEAYARRVLIFFGTATIVFLLAQVALALWARHEITQVESVVANQSASLATGHGYYFRLKDYPFTVTAYTPLFYLLQAGLHRLGCPLFVAGRLISLFALAGVIFLSCRLLKLYLTNRYCVATGTLLIASTANLGAWGTVGQVDVLGLLFSLSAFYGYSQYRGSKELRHLWWTGLFLVLAAFTKQTMVAAGAAIVLLLAIESVRRAAWFASGVAACAAAIVVGLNFYTRGGFLASVLWANINPFSAGKLLQHLQYVAIAGGSLVIMALAGARHAVRPALHPLYAYLATAAAVWVATGAKIGSDLNYELEILTVLGLCAAWSLDQLQFFPKCFRSDGSHTTLLQIPLLFSIVMNLAITGKTLLVRAGSELAHRDEYAVLQPYLAAARGPILSVEMDPLVQAGRLFDVEALIYTLLVDAGRIDPEPVRRDLAAGKFSLVILYEDVFSTRSGPRNPEIPTLPAVQLEEIRKRYRLVRQIPGPFLNGAYLYQPAGS